jgi:hypothetical protein
MLARDARTSAPVVILMNAACRCAFPYYFTGATGGATGA